MKWYNIHKQIIDQHISNVYVIFFMSRTDEDDWVPNYHVEFNKDEANNVYNYFSSNSEEFKNVIIKRFDEASYTQYSQPMVLAKERVSMRSQPDKQLGKCCV